MTADTAEPTVRPRLASDGWRSTAAVVPAVVLAVAVPVVGRVLVASSAVAPEEIVTALSLLSAQAAWIGYSAGYAVLTVVVFGRLDGGTFAAWAPPTKQRSRWTGWLVDGGGGFSWGAQTSVVALIAVLALTRTDAYRGAGVVVAVGGVAMVVGCWVITLVSYALHHARTNLRHGGYAFGGDERPVFTDYLSIAAGVATLLGPNVDLTTNAARRAVSGQAVLAFVFNAVVVAVLVSTLLG